MSGAPSTRLPRLHALLMGEIELCIGQVQAHQLMTAADVAAEHQHILDAVTAGDAARPPPSPATTLRGRGIACSPTTTPPISCPAAPHSPHLPTSRENRTWSSDSSPAPKTCCPCCSSRSRRGRPRSDDSPRALTIEDLRAIAQRRTPKAPFDYTEGAAEAELSLARARQAFEDIEFHPAILRDVSTVDTGWDVLGKRVELPFGIAPTGFTRMMQTEGEIAGASAAAAAGIPFALSTMGTTAIEDVAAAGGENGRNWFQLYMWKDREKSMALVDRAAAAGFDTLLVTVDVPVAGARLRDKRNGFAIPPQLTPGTVLNALPRPAWWINFLTTEPLAFASLSKWSGTVGELLDAMFDPTVTYDDLAWIKEQWPGKLVVKGVQTVDDAKKLAGHRRRRHHPLQPRRAPARPRADPVPPAARGRARGRQRHRGPPRHRHHVGRRHRGVRRARRPLHDDRACLPLRPHGRRTRRASTARSRSSEIRSRARCDCSAPRLSTNSSPAT